VVGQREVPGKPSLYGTTRAFLDYFDLKSLDQLPPLTEIRALVEPLVLDEVVAEPAPGPTPQNQTEPTADAGTQQAEQHVEAETGPHGAVEAAAGAHEVFHRRDEEQDERQRSESLVDGQEQSKDRKQDRQWTREPDETETEAEAEAEDGADQSAGAEVVRLPTNPRR
jgi:segregation and condensation protein B